MQEALKEKAPMLIGISALFTFRTSQLAEKQSSKIVTGREVSTLAMTNYWEKLNSLSTSDCKPGVGEYIVDIGLCYVKLPV